MQRVSPAYIAEDLCLAPEYHLEKNINKELPAIEPDSLKSKYLDALAEISAIQIFEDIPGIKQSRITIDANSLFEIWQPIPQRILLIGDLEFLRSDRSRIENIVEKLIWIGDAWLSSEIIDKKTKIATWEDALNIIDLYDYQLDFISVNFCVSQIVLETHNDRANQPITYWGLYPNCWQIHLHKVRTFNGGFVIDDYNTPYSFKIEVWSGTPIFRNQQTGESLTINCLYF